MAVVVGVMGVVMGVMGVVVGIIGVVVGERIVVGVGVNVGVGAVVGGVVVVVTSDFDCIFVLIKNGYRSPGSIKKIKCSLIQKTDFWSGHTTKSLKISN